MQKLLRFAATAAGPILALLVILGGQEVFGSVVASEASNGSVHGVATQFVMKAGIGDADMLGQFRNYPEASAPFNAAIRTGIALLFSSRSPSAIARFVDSRIVDAIQGTPLWTFSHISQKRLEAIQPSFTYYNSASAVAKEGRMDRIVAAHFHSAPTAVFTRVFMSTNRVGRLAVRSVRAAATSDTAALQLIGPNIAFRATIANAAPAHAAMSATRSTFRNDSQSPKALSS